MKQSMRLLCLFLILIISATALISCGEQSETSASTQSNASSLSNAEVSDDSFRLDKEDFGGTVLTVLSANNYDYQACELAPLALNTEPVNDAAYNRAVLLEQEYGIKLEQTFVECTFGLYAISEALREAVITGTDTYQLICAPLHYLAILCTDDAYHDLSSIDSNDYLDITQPYWDQSTIDDLSLKGKTYFLNGDAIVSDDEATWAIFFNKDIAESHHVAEAYGASDLYEIVNNGDWTLDVLYAMAKEVTQDVDGGGLTWSLSTKDIWGLNAQFYDAYAFTVGTGETMTRLENGIPIITIGEEANVKAYEKVYNILTDKQTVSIVEIENASSPTKYDDIVQFFANGNALFMPEKIGTVSTQIMRNANIRYSLLPMPKLDKTQDNYTSTVTIWWCSALAIPITNVEKFDATCYALEALAYYGQKNVTPEYYERTLKYKRFPDDEKATDMLDLIFKNRTYDIGAVMNFGEDMLYFYSNMISNGNNTHISALDSSRDRYQNAIDDFVDGLS